MNFIFSATEIDDKIIAICKKCKINYENMNLSTIKKHLFAIHSKIDSLNRISDDTECNNAGQNIYEPKQKHLRLSSDAISSESNGSKHETLNAQQQFFIESIGQELRNGLAPKIYLLDSPPGTGKSFTLKHLIEQFDLNYTAIVYSNYLVNDFKAKGMHAKTNFSFLNRFFRFSDEGSKKFEVCNDLLSDEATLLDTFYKIYKASFNLNLENVDIFIIDEYTVVSPWLLAMVICACFRENINLLIVGDGDQLASINKSKFQISTNRGLLTSFVDMKYTLRQQMRIKSETYQKVIEDFKEKVQKNHMNMETPLTFDLTYFIFEQYPEKFFNNDIEARYLSQIHKNCKDRQVDIISAWEKEDSITKYVYPTLIKFNGGKEPLTTLKSDKFLFKLPLAIGKKYLWHNQEVVLLGIYDEYLSIQNSKGQVQAIYETEIANSSMHPEKQQELWKQVTGAVVVFDLTLNTSTYHSVQGVTFHETKLILDCRKASANSIYVGMSRVVNSDQIVAFRCENTFDYIFTYMMNDSFYYRVVGAPKNEIKTITENFLNNKRKISPDSVILKTLYTTKSKRDFLNLHRSIRIDKKLFESPNNYRDANQITQILHFLKTSSTILFQKDKKELDKEHVLSLIDAIVNF